MYKRRLSDCELGFTTFDTGGRQSFGGRYICVLMQWAKFVVTIETAPAISL
jgi:hypothetical protein